MESEILTTIYDHVICDHKPMAKTNDVLFFL